MMKDELLTLAERYDAEGIRISKKALDPRGVHIGSATAAAHCFSVAAALRARAAKETDNDRG